MGYTLHVCACYSMLTLRRILICLVISVENEIRKPFSRIALCLSVEAQDRINFKQHWFHCSRIRSDWIEHKKKPFLLGWCSNLHHMRHCGLQHGSNKWWGSCQHPSTVTPDYTTCPTYPLHFHFNTEKSKNYCKVYHTLYTSIISFMHIVWNGKFIAAEQA